MKTNLFKYIAGWALTGCLSAIFSGCNDVMDTKPFDKFSEDLVWSSRANIDAYMYSTYNAIVSGVYAYIEFVNEETWTPNSVDLRGTADTRETYDRSRDFGFNKFGDIRSCNLAIEKVQASTTLSNTDKTELVAEAKFLRAMIYAYMAKRFGIFVWVDKTLSVGDDFKLPTTPDVKTSYGYVIKDLEDAIAGLPENPKIDRANKYTAYALLSRVCLQAAAYTGDASYYQKAIDASDAVINSGKYSLETDYESMFNEDKPNSGEIIFAKYRNSLNTQSTSIADWQNIVPNLSNTMLETAGASPLYEVAGPFGWLWWSPTQDLIDEYEVIDQTTGKAVDWDKSSQFLASVAPDPVGGTVRRAGHVTDGSRINELMYYHRDNRFYGTIVYDSCQWLGINVTTCIRGNMWRLVKGAMEAHCGITNYYFRKGVYINNTDAMYSKQVNYHWVVFRLGEMYLNKAEALLRQGKIPEAVAALNRTRTVHGGLPPVTASTSADAWKAYKRERRVDLVKEGDYYWSLLRWGKYGGDANYGAAPGAKIPELSTSPTFIEITKDRKSYTIEDITHNQNNVRIFNEDRRYLFPIPQGQRDANPNLGQNPGW